MTGPESPAADQGGFAPLGGLRVVEIAQNLAGPWAARILGDLGASVVKIEPPAGDSARAWGPPFDHGVGTLFTVADAGKRHLRLDLADADDRAVALELLAEADVLVESFRPGALDRLGLPDALLVDRNARLIRASVRAFGETGPLAGLPGYEPLMQAQAGIMSYTGEADGEPVRVGTSVVDLGTGMWLALGVLAALRERDRTGRGLRVGAALWDTALAWSGYHLLGVLAGGDVPGRHGTGLPMICPYGTFPTSDGRLMIAVGNDRLWERFARALDRAEWLEDVRFATNPDRVAHRADLEPAVRAATARHATGALLELLRGAGVPAAPVLDVGEVLDHPQTAASELVDRRTDGPSAIRIPLRFDGVRPAVPESPAEPSPDTPDALD